jgi:hypothetical protein
MPLGDILKRHAKQFISGDPMTRRDQPSLEEDLREEYRDVLDPIGARQREREAAEQAAEREALKHEPGTGQMVDIAGYPGRWEALELLMGEPDTATFRVVDRETVKEGQLGATDDGSVVFDAPDDQFSGRTAGAFWYDGQAVGIRLAGAELRSDGRSIRVTCDLRASL